MGVDPSESLFLDAQIPFSAVAGGKSVAGPLSRFLHCSDIWCPVCARMPPLHSGVCFWRCTWILCSFHTPTCTPTIYFMPYTCRPAYRKCRSCCIIPECCNWNEHYLPLQVLTWACVHLKSHKPTLIQFYTHTYTHAHTSTAHLALTPVQEHMPPLTPLRISVINQTRRCRLCSTNTHLHTHTRSRCRKQNTADKLLSDKEVVF